jgi:hypothetical protein
VFSRKFRQKKQQQQKYENVGFAQELTKIQNLKEKKLQN